MDQPLLISALYGLCALLLSGGALYLAFTNRQENSAIRWFVGVCLALLIWLVTLFLFLQSEDAEFVLQVGRSNFAAVSLAVYAGWRLVKAVAGRKESPYDRPLLYITWALTAVSALTPLVDKAEIVSASVASGRHETIYGLLFPLYVAHVVGLLGAALYEAFHGKRRSAKEPHRRDQLLLLGWGILATSTIGLISNVILPYAFGNFAWIDLGPISTLLFLFSVAYAIARHRLFDIRVFLRRGLVLGMALSLVLAAYSALVFLVTEQFASSDSGGVTRFGVLVLVFFFDRLQRFLDRRIDRILFSAPKKLSNNS
ncbi:MAG: histidine kinase N-terminal 7TM domain-containing protein [Armatimonas sp.]